MVMLSTYLPQKDVTLALPHGLELTLHLGFYLVWLSEYCLTVEVNPPPPLPRTTSHKAFVISRTSTYSESGVEGAGDRSEPDEEEGEGVWHSQ